MTTPKYKLDNLIAIIDKNNLQIDGFCDEVMPTKPLGEKFASFGWEVFHADGHNVDSLLNAYDQCQRFEGGSYLSRLIDNWRIYLQYMIPL